VAVSPSCGQGTGKGKTAATTLRRRGLGLARSRGQQASSYATPAPAAPAGVGGAATAEGRVPHGGSERVFDETVRAQLLYVLEASATTSQRERDGWLGTNLFPKPDVGDGEVDCLMDDGRADGCFCGDTCSDQGVVCQASCGADGYGARRVCVGRKAEANKSIFSSRVRARPSWGTAKSLSVQKRDWLGIRSGGSSIDKDDDCWGDGDGHLTLKPFPTAVETAAAVAAAEGARSDIGTNGGLGDVAKPTDDAQLCPKGQGSPAPISRVDRFLEVFSRLQPARKALNLYESPPPSPTAREGRCVGLDVEVGGDSAGTCSDRRGGMASSEPMEQTEHMDVRESKTTSAGVGSTQGGAGIGAGAARGSSAEVDGEMTTPLSKRPALQPLSSSGVSTAAAAANEGPSVKAVANTAVDHHHGSSSSSISGRKASRETPGSPKSRHQDHQPAHGRVDELLARSTGTGDSVGRFPSSVPAVGYTTKKNKGREWDTHRVGHAHARETYLPKDDVSASASSSSRPGRARSPASVSPTSQAPAAMPMLVETTAVETAKRRKSATPVDRAQAPTRSPSTPGSGGEEPPSTLGNSRRITGDLAGASVAVAVKRSPPPSISPSGEIDKCAIEIESKSTVAGAGRKMKLSGALQSGTKRSAPGSSQWRGSKSRGPLAHRASSGLLRSADLTSASGVMGLGPAASDNLMESAAVDANNVDVSREDERQGREADVFQKVRIVGRDFWKVVCWMSQGLNEMRGSRTGTVRSSPDGLLICDAKS